jgi:hypothetical protein
MSNGLPAIQGEYRNQLHFMRLLCITARIWGLSAPNTSHRTWKPCSGAATIAAGSRAGFQIASHMESGAMNIFWMLPIQGDAAPRWPGVPAHGLRWAV